MKGKTPGTSRSTPRKEEIIDRTVELVQESGLARLTTKKIAERVGFTEAALFRHFSTKEALLLGLVDRLNAMLLDPIHEIVSDKTLSPSERLNAILRHHMLIILEHKSLPILLLAEASASGDEVLLVRMRSLLHDYLHVLETVMAEGMKSGEFVASPQPDCLALLAAGLPMALAIRHRLIPDEPYENRVQTTLIRFLTQSLLPSKRRGA